MINQAFKHIEKRLNYSDIDINIIFDGDSLTAGINQTGIDQYYPNKVKDYLAPLCKSVTFNSFGVGGQNTQDMLSDLAAQILPLYDSEKFNIIIAWEDVNAILNDSRTAQQNYDDFSNYFTQCETAGFELKILLTGQYPRVPYNQAAWDTGSPSPLDIQKEYFDMCKYKPAGVDHVVDFRKQYVVGGGEGLDRLNGADSVHQQEQGYDDDALGVINALNRYFI